MSEPKSLREQVLEFHSAVDQPIVETPAVPSKARIRLRARLIAEEFFETMEALFGDDHGLEDARDLVMDICATGNVSVVMAELADGLADLDYVVEGTRIEFGIDGGPIAAEVHRANMAKAHGPKRADGKVGKPEGWTPPDIEGELRKQGWKG